MYTDVYIKNYSSYFSSKVYIKTVFKWVIERKYKLNLFSFSPASTTWIFLLVIWNIEHNIQVKITFPGVSTLLSDFYTSFIQYVSQGEFDTCRLHGILTHSGHLFSHSINLNAFLYWPFTHCQLPSLFTSP